MRTRDVGFSPQLSLTVVCDQATDSSSRVRAWVRKLRSHFKVLVGNSISISLPPIKHWQRLSGII